MIKPVAILVLGMFVVVGCVTEGAPSSGANPKPVAHVDRVDLHYKTGSQHWDNVPGPDGLLVRVMFFQITSRSRKEVHAVTVSGEVEFVLYEGKVDESELFDKEAFYIWRFPPDSLPEHRLRTMGLWGYGFSLAWGKRIPQSRFITLIARYTPPGGQSVYSAPVLISLRT